MNAAGYLIEFFKDEKGHRVWLKDVEDSLVEVRRYVDAWKARGGDAEFMATLEACVERWNFVALKPFERQTVMRQSLKSGSIKHGIDWASPADLAILRIVSAEMDKECLHFSKEQRDLLEKLVDDSRDVLSDLSSDIPQGLALYVGTLLDEMQNALREYEFTGDFRLDRAFGRLSVALDVAIEKTPEERTSRWAGVREALKQIIVGLAIAFPADAIAAAQILPQILS